jgi:hypothetical protein
MTDTPPAGTIPLTAAEGRLLETLAAGATLVGAIDELAVVLPVDVETLDACFHSLKDAGWIVLDIAQDHRLTVRLDQ